jgi:tetratricopeptide (TPR) repeat protein
MTHSERVKVLEQFLKDDPSDPFSLYALALEYLVIEKDKARQLFELLLIEHPDYLPTYYIAANFFLEGNDREKATQILSRGLALAKAQKDMTTTREIQSALENLQD